MIIGSHISLDNILEETKKVYQNGGTIIQLFINLNMIDEYKKLKDLLDKLNMKCVIHVSYSIVCTKKWNKYSWWIRQLIAEIEIASSILNAFAVVIHIGSNKKENDETSLNYLYTSLLYVAKQTNKNIKILLETPSGQDGKLCLTYICMCSILTKFKHNRFGLCIDTCHIYVSGYNVKNNPLEYFNEIIKLIGIDYINLVHLNDSAKELGSYNDKHANIGEGFIGLHPLIKIVKLCDKNNIPMIIETRNRYNDIKVITNNI